ncbi:MAG: DUF58 domain-containing protein [Deltaproteobacteria bacterium]|nr:MAG: DUF58 domain-containing protein [Deltaproteobacteria bacterium]
MDHRRDPRAGSGSALTRFAAALRRWLRPPRTLRPTRAGWLFFGLTFGVGFAALNTGNNLLYLVLSFMLAFLILSGLLSESALRGVRVKRLLPREAQAGVTARVVLEIENHARRAPAFAIAVEDLTRGRGVRGVRATGRVFALRVAAGDRERRSYAFAADRRGWFAFQGFRVSTRFPFGLFSKSLYLDAPDRLLVYPRMERLRAPELDGTADPHDADTRTRPTRGAQVSGLREFAAGDSLRRIHWRATARRGALVVREPEGDAGAEIEVRLRTAGEPEAAIFERDVAWAASEIATLIDAELRVGLVTDADRIAPRGGPRQRARLLAFLALVQPDRAGRPEPAARARRRSAGRDR